MPDILPVCMQDQLHGRQPELRIPQIRGQLSEQAEMFLTGQFV